VRWFRSLRDLPRPVHVRPLHEGNGDWYPWGVFNGVNEIRDYVPAFRHIVRLLWSNADGRGRVQWCVNRMNGRQRTEPVRDWNLDSSTAALDAFAHGITINRGVGWAAVE
jgi:endoglucanase